MRDFQFPRKEKLKIKHQLSIFSIKETRKLKFDPNFQFLWKMEIEVWMPIKFMYLSASRFSTI